MITSEKPFVSFVSKRFVFLTGTSMVAPLFQIYYLSLGATEFWIALINIAANITVIMGYFFWMGQTRRRGSRMVLLSTTLGVSIYPILVGLTTNVWPMAFYAAMAGIFNAGLNLVLFDELMKRVPFDYSATFVAAAQGLQYLSAIFAPLLATWISDTFGFSAALIVGGLVSLVGFGLFLQETLRKPELAKDGIQSGAESQSK
jgi:MFS family permease